MPHNSDIYTGTFVATTFRIHDENTSTRVLFVGKASDMLCSLTTAYLIPLPLAIEFKR